MKNKRKKQIRFSTSIPAIIEGIQPSTSKHTTSAKLRVFYKGSTSDGRVFSESFSQKLLVSLPETPVVAFYNEEEGDFEGHAAKQAVFGYVPENAAIYFQNIEGVEWAVTDVKLFTEREDIGEIASKIVGKQHSLELDPNSVEFNFLEDEDPRGWLEFIDGDLIGLSVLGDGQNPAFSGSHFFEESELPSLDEIVAKYLTLPKEINVFQTGGTTEMFKDFIKSLFAEDDVLYLLENERLVIYRVGDKVYINLKEDGELINIDITQAFNPQAETEEELEVAEEETEEAEEAEEEAEAKEEAEAEETEVETEVEEEAQVGPQEEEQQGEGVESEAPQDPTNATALNAQEREELESYRRQDKERILDKYSKYLTDNERTTYLNGLDSFTILDLEKELSFVSMQKLIAEEDEENNREDFTFTGIKWNGKSESKSTDELESTVAHYLPK